MAAVGSSAGFPAEWNDFGSEPHDQSLLVLTDGQDHSLEGLSLPFARATVLEVHGGHPAIGIEEKFDTVVIERGGSDLDWLIAATHTASQAVRTGGNVIVVFAPRAPADSRPAADAPEVTGLEWRGLGIVNGHVCACMKALRSVDSQTGLATTLLVTADSAIRLAAAATRNRDAQLTQARRALAEQIADQQRSELALVDQLETLLDELDRQRRQHEGLALVRTVLGSSKLGRAGLRVARPGRRLAKRLAGRLRGRRRISDP